MLGHERSIWQIALSDDGRRLASSSTDSTVRVWDLNTRQQIGGPLRTQYGRFFTSSVWSPDGRSILTGDSVGKIYLWDAPQLDDHPVIPQVATPIAPLLVPSASLSRANSISSSILNLPAGSQPPNQAPATNRLPDDFFDSSPDTIPIATVPSRSSISNTTKPKTDPKTPSTSAPSLQPLGYASPDSPRSSGHGAPTSSGHATPTLSGHAAPQSSGRTTPASSHNAMPTSSHYAMPTSLGYSMTTSPGSVAEQLIQNIRWTG
ncbi:hypothetical protein BJ138DRAFT_1190852 [Hygrophoropsis aurantiaca]|uniref:Uncharacterized protein n=1 Tax=Hygrophoropsis aurantiaca TaxID=72124 RepID=A0ACB7ZRY4_9AGAM|nr:hypothetical protein BJ138DRAFT_1190852 [Hygrophoropsis aurantiaca]